MEVRILGPLEIEVGGREARLGPRQGALLALLALEAGRVIPRSRLIELLWGDPAPHGAETTLRSHVLHLRQVLEPERGAGEDPTVLVAAGTGEGAGYALRILPEQLDAARFEALLDRGRRALDAGDHRLAAEHLGAALGLWRGEALADLADRSFALPEAARLGALRLAAQEALVAADLAAGRHAEVVGDLTALVAGHPDHEGLRMQLALALYRCHRADEAARVCQEGLELLADRGLDSPALQARQRDILRRVPELDWSEPAAETRAVTPRLYQLPPDVVEFTGREAELQVLEASLSTSGNGSSGPAPAVHVVAIDGKPGVGKSALAVHLAHRLEHRFPDGVLYANLRGAEPRPPGPMEVLAPFLRALGVAGERAPGDVEAASAAYRSLLAGTGTLVLLDDAADAAQVRPLLPATPGCSVIVTSRTQLADLDGAVPLTLDLMTEADAIALLTAFAGSPRVDGDPEAASTVVHRCGLLPLAVRIAGARLRARPAWTIAALAGRLADEGNRLGELEVGSLAVRSSFQLSYGGLSEADARTFRLLGLIDGPHATPAGVAALTERTSGEAEASLERLVDAQLLETPAPGRYRFHDLLRLFARERAELEEGERLCHAAVERSLAWYLAITEQADALLGPAGTGDGGPGDGLFEDRAGALGWLEMERGNLVAAARQAAGRAPAPVASVAWRLSYALFRFFFLRKHWPDWEAVCQAAVLAAQESGNRVAEAAPRNNLGIIFLEQRRYDEALACFEESLEIRREAGDRLGEGKVLCNLGCLWREEGRLEEALASHEQSLAIFRELGDCHREAGSLHNMGNVYREQRRYEQTLACFGRALTICRTVGDRNQEASVLKDLGNAHREMGRLDEAIACFERARELSREMGNRHVEAMALKDLGSAVRMVRGPEAARACWRQALELLLALGAPEADDVLRLMAGATGALRTGS